MRKRVSVVRHPLEGVLSSATSTFARHAIEIENLAPWTGGRVDCERERQVHRVMQYATGAVMVAVAALEAMVNEMLESAAEMLDGTGALQIGRLDRPKNVTTEGLRRWQSLWKRGFADRRLDVLEKIQLVLELADLQPLPQDRGSAQNLRPLITLRNELVHHRPAFRVYRAPPKKLDNLEKKLAGKFKPSAMVPETYNFIWYRCLSADCARWAASTVAAVETDFYKRLGIPVAVEIALPEVRGG